MQIGPHWAGVINQENTVGISERHRSPPFFTGSILSRSHPILITNLNKLSPTCRQDTPCRHEYTNKFDSALVAGPSCTVFPVLELANLGPGCARCAHLQHNTSTGRKETTKRRHTEIDGSDSLRPAVWRHSDHFFQYITETHSKRGRRRCRR